MIIINAGGSDDNTSQIELPHDGLVVDPRPNRWDREWTFDVKVEGRLLSITRTSCNNPSADGWHELSHLTFRAYAPEEEKVPDFNSSEYTYLGIEGERAPYETTVGIVHPSIRKIHDKAFMGCENMTRCSMGDGVRTIGKSAFANCTHMETIRLSKKLKRICYRAFDSCTSIDGIFLPPSVKNIEDCAFLRCRKMRILSLPPDIKLDKVGHALIHECDALLEAGRIQYDVNCVDGRKYVHNTLNNEQINPWIKARHKNLPLLRICHNTSIDAQMIEDLAGSEYHQEKDQNAIASPRSTCINRVDEHGLSPLHILAINPHATPGAIAACFNANPNSAFALDNRGACPVDYLWKYNNVEGIITIMQALSLYRDAM